MKFFTIYVKAFQSIYDLAVQQYGSVDHIDVLITDNPTLDLENDLAVGTQVKIRTEMSVLDEAALKYFTESGDQIATWENNGVSPGYTPESGVCEPVESTFNGTPLTSAPAGSTKTITAKDTAAASVGTIITDTAGSLEVEIQDSSVVVKDSAGATLHTVSVKAENTANQTVTDSTVLLKDNLGNTLDSVSVKAEASINKNVSDFVTKKVYYTRPDILNVASYATYDEGWMYANNYDPPFHPTDGVFQQLDYSVSPDYLKYNNAFGHKFRFTGLNGGYYDFNTASYKTAAGAASTYNAEFRDPVSGTGSDGYIIDHLTGIGHRAIRGGVDTWANNLTIVESSTLFGFSNWYCPPISWLMTLVRSDVINWLFPAYRPPFQYDQGVAWSCTTYPTTTTQVISLSSLHYTGISTKTGTTNKTWARIHYARNSYVLQ